MTEAIKSTKTVYYKLSLPLQDREFVDMDLPFNGVGLPKNKKHSISYPPSPTASQVNTGCLTCCCGNKTGAKESQQVGLLRARARHHAMKSVCY